MNKEKITLTTREWNELQWFIRTVLDWGSGGPYGDGENITEKKGEKLMQGIAKKITAQRSKRFGTSEAMNKVLQSFANVNYDEILKK